MSDREDLWGARARELLAEAASADGDDLIIAASAAIAAEKIAMGELPEDELAGWYDEPVCVCPPDLLERGGFKGGCRAHG